MLNFTPTFLCALLLSSVPVFSHVIPNTEGTAIEATQPSALSVRQESNHIEIAVKPDGEESEEANSEVCKRHSSKCFSESTKRYGFRCGKKFYNQAQILAAAKAACPRISKNSQRHIFPAPYTYSSYQKPGPYVQWPIQRNGRFWNMGQ